VVALPVLIATTGYVVGAHLDWHRGLSEPIGRARGFYAILAASTGLAVAVSLAGIPVIGMLVAASVAGGLATPVGLLFLVRLARDSQVMGTERISRRLAIAGWAVTVIVAGLGILAILSAAAGVF
jgi:Mn2+/Fe2+ NRAMP family transporter